MATAESSSQSQDDESSTTTDSGSIEGGGGRSAPTASERLLKGGGHMCSYCDIVFLDSVMHTMHMGYHGFQNPFTCNMCGEELKNKVDFFLHVAKKSHA